MVATTCGGSFLDVTNPLTLAGTYTVLIDPNDASTGSTTVMLYDVPADATGILTINDAAIGFGRCHCFIGLDDGTTLGAYRFGMFLQPLNDYQDDRPYPPPPCCSKTRCTDIALTPADQRDVRRRHKTMVETSPMVYLLQGTSNTPVQDLLRPYGIPLPGCAFGANPPVIIRF